MDKPFTVDDLLKAIEKVDSYVPTVNIPELDDYVNDLVSLDEVMMVTGDKRWETIPEVKTQHGMLKVSYNPYMPRVGDMKYMIVKTMEYPNKPKF